MAEQERLRLYEENPDLFQKIRKTFFYNKRKKFGLLFISLRNFKFKWKFSFKNLILFITILIFLLNIYQFFRINRKDKRVIKISIKEFKLS